MLDIRLAINPWLAMQARARAQPATVPQQQQQQHLLQQGFRLEPVFVAGAGEIGLPLTAVQRLQQQQQHGRPALSLNASSLEGVVEMGLMSGPLSAAERKGCIVTSHSLPGAPLTTVLADICRFLQENPGEVRGGFLFR